MKAFLKKAVSQYGSTLERAARTFVQATAAAMVIELARDGASWAAIPEAGSVGAFAGLLALLMAVAGPLAPKRD